MANKSQHQRPEDDWAGLAQNLFGINLDKPASGDDDLLDEDMFKVEIPKPPVAQAEVEFAPAETAAPVTPPRPATVVAARPAPAKIPAVPKRKLTETVAADSFGAGLEEFGIGIDEAVVSAAADDDGLTLPDDYDSEGLTLPADYDDGLTLPPEFVTATTDDLFASGLSVTESDDDLDEEDEDEEDDDEEEDEEEDEVAVDDSELEAVGEATSAEAAAPGQPRGPRRPRRTREDAYWDMLENWEWEEIPASDAPRAEGSGSRFGRDRGGKPGPRGRDDRSRRTERPRDDQARTERAPRSDDRPRPADRPRAEAQTRDERPRSESRPPESRPPENRSRQEDRPATSAPPRSRAAEGPSDRPRTAGRGDRPREDRPRDEPRRDEPRPAAVSTPQPKPTATDDLGDFGSGIFEQPSPAAKTVAERPTNRGPENDVAQSTQAADKVLPRSAARRPHTATSRPVEEELVWPEEDDSDVRLVPTDSVVETSAFPAAETDDESDESPVSSVTELEPGEASRPRRRRRRRGGRRPDGAAAGGDEGTTFDLNEVLDEPGETADFIPASASDDSAVSEDESEITEGTDVSDSDEDRPSSERRGRRRRRRRRPDSPVAEVSSTSGAEEVSFAEEAPREIASDLENVEEVEDEDEDEVVPVITYAKMPSWEEAIRYLLNPHLVGRNLDPEDEVESLIGDPRGSGGSEPTPPPPAQRRYRRTGGGGGRGRR